MTILTNKKGVTGYIVTSWSGITRCDATEFKNECSYMVRKIEIKSCGKVQMTASMLDNSGDMAKHFFNPETKVFATFEDAAAQVPAMFETDLDRVVSGNDEMLERVKEGFEKYQNKPWREGLDKALVNHAVIAKRAIKCKVLSYQEWAGPLGYL